MTTSERPYLADGRWPIAHCDAAECRAPIVWALTEKAKRMPVDAQPSDRGTVALRDAGWSVPVAVVLKADRAFGRTDLRTSHFAMCPAAQSFRRGRP
jgi:hypothetical protein